MAAEGEQQRRTHDLVEALNAAIGANPSLRAAQLGADIAADEARLARGALLPSLTAEASHTQIDASHANPLLQAEKTTAAGGTFKQVLYSDSAWAGWSVSRQLAAAADEQARQELLDTIAQTSTGYFNVLRAKSVEIVRRQNVENTPQESGDGASACSSGSGGTLRLSAMGRGNGARPAGSAVRRSQFPPGDYRARAAHSS
ncbi:MAG: TolC family protein [Gammaproteobacteria bacterium]